MNSSAFGGTLSGKVAAVTGASRGAGRGIAVTLGEAGAIVYVRGRSVRGEATTENLPGTIEETAEMVTARGGGGIAVRCDHTCDSDVEDLFRRVQRDHEGIDLLVNNAWGGYEHHDYQSFSAPFTSSRCATGKECLPQVCVRLWLPVDLPFRS